MELFKAGDWVKIKYGEFEGRLAKIAIHKKSGEYGVILYENQMLPQAETKPSTAIIMLNENALLPLPPYVLPVRQLKALLSAEMTYDELAEKVYPPFNLKLERRYTLMAADIRKALIHINKQKDPLPRFKEWFWIILNVFYEDLGIPGKYDPDLFSDFPKDERRSSPRFSA